MSQEFGAYFQCYRSPMATYKCLESFRRHYPTSTVVLLSDNGYNYAKMAEHFDCVYIHCDESCHLRTHLQGDYRQKVYALFERFKHAFDLIPEEYIMWLEDDVFLTDKITDTFRYDINGFCPNYYSPDTVRALQQRYPLKNDMYRCSGHGGSVLHKKKILECMNNHPVLDDVLLHWSQYHLSTDICQDYLLSLLVHVNQGTIGPYKGHVDCYRDLDLSNQVHHQYKVWYNVPLPPELDGLVRLDR